jgi:hypothetical protein
MIAACRISARKRWQEKPTKFHFAQPTGQPNHESAMRHPPDDDTVAANISPLEGRYLDCNFDADTTDRIPNKGVRSHLRPSK